jgi:glycosyltransferase involved in cell wall biosynthesis
MSKEGILRYIEENAIQDIKFLNPVPKNKILSYLSTADIFWVGMPDSDLYKYGISFNKLYDYMAVKKPIIISAPKNTDNIIKTANCGLIAEADNYLDLADKIIQLYNMTSTERVQLADNGYNYLINNFTIQLMVSKLEQEVIVNS